MSPEPVALSPPAGSTLGDQTPEPRRVIGLAKVAELVHDHVVEHVERREHEPPVERQRAAEEHEPQRVR